MENELFSCFSAPKVLKINFLNFLSKLSTEQSENNSEGLSAFRSIQKNVNKKRILII